MRNFREGLGVFFIAAIYSASLLALDAAKYDTADRIWLILILGVLTILIAIFFSFTGIRKHPLFSLLLGGWVVLVWIALYYSQTKNFGFSEAVIFSFSALLGISLSTAEEQTQKYIGRVILIIAVISSLYGFWYFPTHGETRMAGLFLDAHDPRHFFPNAFANFLLMAWPLVFLGIRGKVFIKILVTSILFTALYLTYSRGAWTALLLQLVGLIVISLFQHKARVKTACKKYVIPVVLLALIIGTLLVTLRGANFRTISLKEKILFENAESATSFAERKDFWLGSLQLIKNASLMGYGPMSFRYVYPRVQKKFLAISDHPHNFLLKMAVEEGIPTVGIFILFLLSIGYAAVKYRVHFDAVLLAVALLGGFVHNLVDYNLNFIPTVVTFFILAGSILAITKKDRPGSNKLSAIALTLWLLIIVMVMALSSYETKVIVQTNSQKSDSERIAAYAKSLMPRDFFLTEASKLLQRGNVTQARELLSVHLSKNALDAYAAYLAEDVYAFLIDPLNHFSYYRLYLEKKKKLPPDSQKQLDQLLAAYDKLLADNIHYTAFGDNPEEAAKIYDFMGKHQRAADIRAMAEKVRKEFAKNNDFNKSFGPRTPLDFFR